MVLAGEQRLHVTSTGMKTACIAIQNQMAEQLKVLYACIVCDYVIYVRTVLGAYARVSVMRL